MAVDPRTGPLPEDDSNTVGKNNSGLDDGLSADASIPVDNGEFLDFDFSADELTEADSLLEEFPSEEAPWGQVISTLSTEPALASAGDELVEEISAAAEFDEPNLDHLLFDQPESANIVAASLAPESGKPMLGMPPSDTDVLGAIGEGLAGEPSSYASDIDSQTPAVLPAGGDSGDAFDFGRVLETGPGASAIRRREPTDGSSVNLGGRPNGSSIVLGSRGTAGSSVFDSRIGSKSAVGSGWDETPPEPVESPPLPSVQDSAVNLDDLFMEPGEVVAMPASGWIYEQPAMPISHSSVLRDLEDLGGRLPIERSIITPELPEASASGTKLDAWSNPEDRYSGPSGVNLLDPDYSLSDPLPASQSSIFGNEATEDMSKIDLEPLPATAEEGAYGILDAVPYEEPAQLLNDEDFPLDDLQVEAFDEVETPSEQALDDLAFAAFDDNEPVNGDVSFALPEPTAENVYERTLSTPHTEDSLEDQAFDALDVEPAEESAGDVSFEMPEVSAESVYEQTMRAAASDVWADDNLTMEDFESDPVSADQAEGVFSFATPDATPESESEVTEQVPVSEEWGEEPLVAEEPQEASMEWSVEAAADEAEPEFAEETPTDFEALASAEWADAGVESPAEDPFANSEWAEPAAVGTNWSEAEIDPDALAAAAWSDTGVDQDEVGHATGMFLAGTAAEPGTAHRYDRKTDDPNETRPLSAVAVEPEDPFDDAKARKRRPIADKQSAPRKSRATAWLGGGVFGLLAGAGAFAGLYYAQVLPPPGGEVAQVKPNPTPNSGPAANPAEVEKLTAELATAKLDSETRLKAEADKLLKANTDLAKKDEAIKEALADATTAKEAESVAAAKLKEADKAAVDAKKLAEEKAKELTASETKVTDAMKKLQAADDALSTVIKELKANKLLDEKDDGPAALAKLPDVIKSAALAATSADAKKAAEALALVKKQVDTLTTDVKTAEAAATKAAEEAKLASAAALKAKDEADEKAKKAADTAKAEVMKESDKLLAAIQKKFDETSADLKKMTAEAATIAKRAQVETSIKLAEADAARAAEVKKLIDQHTQDIERLTVQIADVRAGVKSPLAGPEVVANDRAIAAYGAGIDAYFARRYSDAESSFTAAVKDNPGDARYWYFLGLSAYELGHSADAEAAFKKGGDLESRYKPGSREVGAALERVQGNARKVLTPYRP